MLPAHWVLGMRTGHTDETYTHKTKPVLLVQGSLFYFSKFNRSPNAEPAAATRPSAPTPRAPTATREQLGGGRDRDI